jgi:Tol biopolymer transport system component
MPLQTGTKLGPYEILEQIGAGGMGEVYKAADSRLNRTVAIKVLPPQFSENLEMRQRFEREAQTVAALNHPNICTLFDVGRQDTTDFLVMEYLEGESLAQRLTHGAIPLNEALKIAIGIADALDKAHAKGVTHRDLKPGNVMLTQSGEKLLDFGLAKIRQQAQTGGAPSGSRQLTADATAPGTILGTMQYMAPEQLEGHDADARTDIFAFGVVLYEMVTGKRAFDGRSQALLIASIMSVDPDPISKSQNAAPPALDYVVKRCLAKDPEKRLQTAWDLLCQLQWIAAGGSKTGMPAPISARGRRNAMISRVGLAVAAVLVVAMAMPAYRYYRGGDIGVETRFLIPVPDMPVADAVSISPDGHWIAYSARDSSSSFVFTRPITSETSTKLAGTEGAGQLFWSPDSKTIAFFAGGRLKRVEAAGGAPSNICETVDLAGGTWNADNVILFASSKGLQRVTATGGEPTPVAAPGGLQKVQEPFFLPDGRHYLFTSDGAVYAGALDSKDATKVVAAQSNAIYVEPGYLLFHRDGTLFAQPFSASSLKPSGEAGRLADKLPVSANGAAAFAASENGVLLFRNNPQSLADAAGSPTVSAIPSWPLLWVDRSGNKTEQAGEAAGYAGVELSPDGKRAAVHRHGPDGGDIYIFELGNSTPSKFTFDASQDNSSPAWSPEGDRIAFGSHRNGKWGLYLKVADYSRMEELLLESDSVLAPMSWSPDGKTLVYWTSTTKTGGDIMAIPVMGDHKPAVIVQTPADERNPQVSPDGKWLAYSSNETGRSEVYIRQFPEGPAKIQVSVNGGVYPRWKHDGRELYFLNLISLGEMMASEIRVNGTSVQREVPKSLFQSVFVTSQHAAGQYNAYAVTTTGQRFLIPQYENPGALYTSAVIARGRGGTITGILPSIITDRHSASSLSTSSSSAPITVVLNWTAALKGK